MLPEQALIRDLARAALGGPAVVGARLAADPRHAITLADELGVLGVTSDQARRASDAHPLWLDAFRANLARNVRLSFEVRRWWETLEAAGHRPVAFKGPALARAAFGSLGRRDSCDIDLIVAPAGFADAVRLLTRMGLKPLGELPLEKTRVGAVTFEVPDASNTYALDLHCGWLERWGGGPDRELPDADLEPVELAGASLRTLGAGRALIHAAIHFEQHGYMLKMLLDVAMTARRARELGVLAQAASLATELGVRRTLDRALTAADSFVRNGDAAGLPRGMTSANALTAPGVRPMSLRHWRRVHPGFGSARLMAEAARAVWPSEPHLRAAPEWVAPDRIALRRVLRPVRLLVVLAQALVPRKVAPAWRQREALRYARPEGVSRRARPRTEV